MLVCLGRDSNIDLSNSDYFELNRRIFFVGGGGIKEISHYFLRSIFTVVLTE